MDVELSAVCAERGMKRAKLNSPLKMSVSPVFPEKDQDLKHSKVMHKKWLDCPIEEGLKAALQRDLEEACDDIDLDEWVDYDESVFGSQLVKNPYEDLNVEEIHKSLPNASYVKACVVPTQSEFEYEE